MPAGLRLRNEGQERQEAKTQDCQDDRRQEAFSTGKGTVHGRYLLKDKQGLLLANTDCLTREGL